MTDQTGTAPERWRHRHMGLTLTGIAAWSLLLILGTLAEVLFTVAIVGLTGVVASLTER